MGLHSNGRLLALPEMIDWVEVIEVENTLAYYDTATIKVLKAL